MPESKDDSPAPEMLNVADKSDTDKVPATDKSESNHTKLKPRLRRGTYRPSHKATFIGLAVIAAILLINGVVITVVVKKNSKGDSSTNRSDVIVSSSVLNKLGVSRNAVDAKGTELIIGPDTTFNGNITVATNATISGQLKLNSKLSASDASITKLQAGDTSLEKLSINGDATATNLNLRKDLSVAGVTRLQGTVTIENLVTINNNLNVTGSLAVGGTLSAASFSANTLTSGSTLTVGGHIITRGSAPGVSGGSALGSNGTVSISGSDAAGTVAANAGAGSSSGVIANINFRSQYGSTPHVVVTPVGMAVNLYINRSSTGFTISTASPISPGGYAFDYIVMQ